MKVKELYDYILTQITAEEALMKMLESGIIQYEKLKFDKQEQAVHPVIIISMAAMDLGWDIAVEKKKKDMEGIAVGTSEYMERTFGNKKGKKK